ncbi:mitochondrial import receptor subunit TOM34-like [Acipenser ruthenus]|uniref:mitochondrial import receptor subunit TOM34-like n=1 Tax=Acipenser ruthenus TaxID=7906 RepID=UPI00145A60BD|nr:mitochondrial import receptor subunit TOM34-like [Acipenser ruthenus]
MPAKRRCQPASVPVLKQSGNECFKNGQYGEAASFYTQAVTLLQKSGTNSPEELSVLLSNRAACFLKEGNCTDCVKDCTASLELVPFGVKPLLRRAAAYEALERYRLAYVDYKTVLQLDCTIKAAHDGTNRMTQALTEQDGPSWREKLPPIPTISLSDRERLAEAGAKAQGDRISTAQQNGTTAKVDRVPSAEAVKRAHALKEEGNAFVKKGEHKAAVEKYTESIELNPKEVTTYTNRALCHLSLKKYQEAKTDSAEALKLDPGNVKALYRRAQAHKELKDYKACVADLNALLKTEPKNVTALKLLHDVRKIQK